MSETSSAAADSSNEPKFWESPAVYLISRPQIQDIQMREFWNSNGVENGETIPGILDGANGDGLIEFAGRMCYMSYNKGRARSDYFKNILESGHGSVLEHAYFTFAIEGVSRSLTHELVRHRAGFAFSQLSQRFVDESNVSFVIPPLMLNDVENLVALKDECTKLRERYAFMVGYKMGELAKPASLYDFALREGFLKPSIGNPELVQGPDGSSNHPYFWIKQFDTDKTTDPKLYQEAKKATYTARKKTALEACRSILPNCTETKITVTANVRAWRHFIAMRGSVHADREIRRLAVSIADKLKYACPLAFQDVRINVAADNLETVELTYPKV